MSDNERSMQDYINLKPPSSTKSYLSADKVIALEHLDVDAVLEIVRPTPDEVDAIRIGAAIVNAFSTSRGRRSGFPSPADVVDIELRGSADFDEPVWDDRPQRHRSVWMLRAVERVRTMLDESGYEMDRVTLTCPECSENSIEVYLHPMVRYDGSEAFFDESEPSMGQLKVSCGCHGITVWDIYEFERSALLECGN